MIGPEVNVPDVTEAVVGFRSFNLQHSTQHNYCLASPHTGDFWHSKRRTARCNKEIVSEAVILDGIRPAQHEAPAKDCGCGIYVYHEPRAVQVAVEHHLRWPGFAHSDRGTPIPAVVTLTGRVEVHARGMRGQYAEVRALGTHERISGDERAALQRIAQEWDVPLVPQAQLARIATEFGLPLDASMKPVPAGDPPEAPRIFVETVPQRKPWWLHPLIPIGCNVVPLAINTAIFVGTQNPVSGASASISAACIAWLWRGARRRIHAT